MLQAAGRLTLTGFIACLTCLPHEARAIHITCGAVLGPGGVYALDGDVGPCDAPGSAITVDSAELDMAGFTVESLGGFSPTGPGIHLTGLGSRLANGVLSGGIVYLEGQGGHTVEGVRAYGFEVERQSRDNQLLANTAIPDPEFVVGSDIYRDKQGLFRIAGDRTTLVGNAARGGRIGFLVLGKSNTLRRNTASGQHTLSDGGGGTLCYLTGGIGFEVYGTRHILEANEASGGFVDPDCDGGYTAGFEIGAFRGDISLRIRNRMERQQERKTTRVTLEGNIATGSAGVGFHALGRAVSLVRNTASGNFGGFSVGGKNTVEDNEASSNRGSGYELSSGVRAARNVAVDNIYDGFRIGGSRTSARTILTENRAERNGTNGIGIFAADGNLIQRNVVRDNGRNGIALLRNGGTARRNKVIGNVVSGHSAGFFDLFDEQPCGTNTWADNTFETKSPECLQ